jgi:hypothetical protein
MSSTTRCGESMASAFAINSRLVKVSPSRFPSWVSSSVSNDCNLEVKPAPRSQIFSEPMRRKALIAYARSKVVTEVDVEQPPREVRL